MAKNVLTFAMNLGELETEVLRRLWIDFNEDDNGWPDDADFTKRVTKTRVRSKINQAVMELATMGQVIRSWFIIPTKQNYKQYPVPQNIYDIQSPIFFFTSATAYEEISVQDEEYLDENFPGWRTESATSSPRYAFRGNWNRMNQYLGITPPPSADATAITLGSGVLEKAQLLGAVEGVESHAGPDTTATKLVDDHAQNFADLGIIPGMYVYNMTDGSVGVITSISTTNNTNDSINVTSLSGGANNQFASADECRFLGGEYGGIMEIGDTEASFIVSAVPGSIEQPLITMAAGNILARCLVYPALLTVRSQYPELPQWAHPAIAARAAGYIAMTYSVDSPEYKQGAAYIQESNQTVATLRGYMAEHFKLGEPVRLQSRRK